MRPGLRLTERYRLMERLDDGDAMEVWRAWDEALSRSVAVKLPDPSRLADTVRGRAFHELASRAAGLRHAAFAAIYDCDQTRDSAGRATPYLVTEYLEGETLAARVDRAPLPTAEALEICARVATALAVAHRDGVAHGDLTPRRIFLTPGGVKIVDVGIGAVLRAAAAGPTSEPPGRAADAAPATPSDRLAIDRAGDVLAFGALLTACLDAGATAARVPDEVTILGYECRASDPLDRPPMSRVADVLARVAAPSASARNEMTLASLFGGDDPAPPDPDPDSPHDDGRTEFLPAPPPPEEPPPDRRPVLVTAAVIAAAAVITAVLVALNRPPPPFREVAAPQPPPATTKPTEPSAPVPEPTDAAPSRPTATRRAVDTSTLGVLGRLQPLVDGGRASGRIRSDVAVDLTNLINNLRGELATGRAVDVDARVAELRRKIDTRLRERALTADAAAELTGVLDQHGG
ncbi:protein kinase [Actinomadura sp. NPDC047616]|uniref:protein kinase domain-containing protein n=1 Tax=Actinomadura sp. NPDC047616 TaxID=3155914 RepID=UPI0033D58117